MKWTKLIIVLFTLLAAGCGGGATLEQQPPLDVTGPGLEDGALATSLGVIRSASGAPQGISLSWLSVDDTDTAGPLITGYRVYKSDSSIPDSARGDESFWVEINAGTLVPQHATPGEMIGPVDDMFAASYGETWFYRLSSVAADGDESRLGPEAQIVVAPFEITAVAPPRLGVGEQFTITGLNFGDYDPTGDLVEVRGVEWQDGTGFVPTLIEATIEPDLWTPTSIVALLPPGATTGPVDLTIGGITVTSIDIITNSDPYITSLTPLAGTAFSELTLEGANFGTQGLANYVNFSGLPYDELSDYIEYTDTLIVFIVPNLQDYQSHELFVNAGTRTSNSGFFTLENAPPVAYLTGTPESGASPLQVTFRPARQISPGNWEYSFDNEGPIVEYLYDYDSDGTTDHETDSSADQRFTYEAAGEYLATLTVVDAEGETDSATFAVNVGGQALELNFSAAPDSGPIFANTRQIAVRYEIIGGVGLANVDWYIYDPESPGTEFLLASDVDLSNGLQTKIFDVDTLTTTVTPGSATIPLGSWQLRAEGSDQDPFNDPDGSFIFPRDEGGLIDTYDVYRGNVGVVSDDEADPTGTEGTLIVSTLESMGYQVTYHPVSSSIDPATLQGHHVVIWATAGSFGTSLPFEWFDESDQLVTMLLLDLGVNFVVFGLPGQPSLSGPVFSNPGFNQLYQPFTTVEPHFGPQSVLTEDFTSTGLFGDYSVLGFDVPAEMGRTPLGTLQFGAVSQSMFFTAAPAYHAAASRVSPTGISSLYVGMYVFSTTTNHAPTGATPGQLLDNIITGVSSGGT